MDKPLTVIQAARILSVHPWQVRKYIRTKQLMAYKLGVNTTKQGDNRRWRIWEADLGAFINRYPSVQGKITQTKSEVE